MGLGYRAVRCSFLRQKQAGLTGRAKTDAHMEDAPCLACCRSKDFVKGKGVLGGRPSPSARHLQLYAPAQQVPCTTQHTSTLTPCCHRNSDSACLMLAAHPKAP